MAHDSERVKGSDGGDAGPLSGLDGLASNIAPEHLDFLKGLIETFNTSTARLKEAYSALQDKVASLNSRLEETNSELSESLDEQERLSNYLTNILESLSSGVLVVDTLGVITLFNRGAEAMLGAQAADVIGRKYDAVFGETVPREQTALWTIATGDSRSQFEKTIRTVSGKSIPAGCSLSPLRNSSGELIGAVEIFMDLTHIKALEDELARQEKLAALGQMAATMAHKIRNPLGGIAGFAGLLKMDLKDNENGRRLVGKISEGVDKLERIVSSLLSYTALLNLEIRMTDLAGIARDAAAVIRAEHGNFDVEIIAVDGQVMCDTDPRQMKTALVNILQNAAETMEFSGKAVMSIAAQNMTTLSDTKVSSALVEIVRESSNLLKSGAPCCMIQIEDSGHGISDASKTQLFVPFFTTRENGIGLGLAMAKKIVEEHRGEIFISSAENEGTAVMIVLLERSAL